MGNFVEVGKTGEMQDGTMKMVFANDQEILLAKIDEEYYATEDRCPHMQARLVLGKLEGTIVTCPRHGSQYNIKTGEVVRWLKGTGLLSRVGKALKPPQQLRTYKVIIEGNSIMVEV
jgi:3-phenylpropionate/trans-cinnamate dioxygenase ferredoxin subunit